MEQLKVIGLDLAKNVFQVHGMDETGKKLFGKKLKRAEVLVPLAERFGVMHRPPLLHIMINFLMDNLGSSKSLQ